ncbi:hypothetical protein BH10ACI1_BH10ACI1_01210 [soil metagenome]
MDIDIENSNLFQKIEESVNEPAPAVSNQKVTAVHFMLSEALQELTGTEAGPNFHSWAVWGSKKAGVTIRQEDLDSALKDATNVSGIVGFVVGLIAAALVIWFYLDISVLLTVGLILVGGTIGAVAGALIGRAIARYSRREAARLILEGNRTVLEDIGGKTAQFVAVFKTSSLDEFFNGFTEGKTSGGGQNLLREAFKAYKNAALAENPQEKRQLTCFGNCLAILHEHIRLQPYISKSLPFIIRRCVTQRMMSFDVGEISLSVAKEFSALNKDYEAVELENEHKNRLIELMKEECPTAKISGEILFDGATSYAADNWASIEQRMRYVWELFERFHLEPQVRSKPF